MTEFQWKNAEGIDLYAVQYDVRNPKAVIAFVHGQGEHIGRYKHVAAFYNKHDIAFVGFDQQGYGKSGGGRGHAKDLDALLDDIQLLIGKTRQLYPDVPLVLYGHSMGGGLVLNYVTRNMPDIDALIAGSPWIRLAFEANFLKVMAGKLLRKFMPTLTLPTGLAANFISRDEAVVNAYKNDPLVHDKLSAAAGIALLEGATFVNNWSGVFPMPVLLMHGLDDKITSHAATKEFFGRVAGDVTHKEWPGLYHEIHNEKSQNEIFEHTLGWINKAIARLHHG